MQNDPVVVARNASAKDDSEAVNSDENNVPKNVIENGVDSEINDIQEEAQTFDIKIVEIVTPGEYSGSKQIQE